ncbi:MAG: hypothetical protein GY769_15055 [bacterium]|nr:hypothetical protein [bacterium]
MNRLGIVSCIAFALVSLPATIATAGHLPLDAVGALHQYCADQSFTPHKNLIVMRQVMMTDELATFGGTLFAGIYTPQVPPSGDPGRITVRVRVRRADGSREKLGKMVAHQGADGVAEAEMYLPVAIREGDTVLWRWRFRNFANLGADECFMLIGATVRP